MKMRYIAISKDGKEIISYSNSRKKKISSKKLLELEPDLPNPMLFIKK